jgi:transposase
VDEAGFYLLPGVVRTYSPAGLTPVLYEWQTRDHLSAMSGVTPEGELFELVREEPLTGAESAGFLGRLLRHGRRWLVVWDRSPIHRGEPVRRFLAGGAGRQVHLELLPPYAPDLNPGEGVWQHLKHVELRNLCCLDLVHLRTELGLAVARLRRRPDVIRGFFAGAGLDL